MKKINNEDLQKQIEKIITGSVTEDLYFDFKQDGIPKTKKAN
jgi:transcriptional accessory protein Tex/SPT6